MGGIPRKMGMEVSRGSVGDRPERAGDDAGEAEGGQEVWRPGPAR